MTATLFSLPASDKYSVGQALQSALMLDLTDVIVIGYDRDNQLLIRPSRLSCADGAFLAQKALHWALSGGDQA